MTHMKNQAIEALLKAHSAGIFIFGKGDMMRNFFHESLDNLFIKQISEPSRTKSDCQKSLLVLIYRIIADDNKCESADHDTQELIDKCKLFYFDLIFKYYNTFEEETKNWLIKIMFYKIIQIPKFKEGSSKPFMGPPTKEDFKLGLKHPINIEENPMLELVKFGLRNAGQEEHESILQFVDILKSKARLTLDISHEILRASIFNTGYLDVIEKTFETTLKIPNIQKFINKIPNEGTESEKLSILISALLENSKTTGDSRPSPGKRNTHKMITDLLLKAPKSYIKLMKSVINYIEVEILVEVLHEIIDEASEDNIDAVMKKHIGAMRSILLALTLPHNDPTSVSQSMLEVVYKFTHKKAWKDNLTWKGILLVFKKCKEDFDINKVFEHLPEDNLKDIYRELDISEEALAAKRAEA